MRIKLGLTAFALAGGLAAQSTRLATLAGTGYRIPAKIVSAAPGQILMFSLYGIAPKANAAVKADPGPSGYPLELNGISVKLRPIEDGPIFDAGIIAMQQTPCETQESGCVITSITALVPIDATADPVRWFDRIGSMSVTDRGAAAGRLPFRIVPDEVHVLNSCDAAMIRMTIFEIAPDDGVCRPGFIGVRGLVSRDNPLRPGEAIAAYLYGLGALRRGDDPFGRLETVQTFDVGFEYRPNAGASRPVAGFGLTAKPILSVGSAAGLYQMNFLVPPIPEGVEVPACDGVRVRSNLTITIAGTNSMDSAAFCVDPVR